MDFESAKNFSDLLRKNTFFVNPLFIMRNCFVKNNLLLENNAVEGQHPLLVYSPLFGDVSNKIIGTGFDEDLEELKKTYKIKKINYLGVEFFYLSDDWLSLEGKSFKRIRKALSSFNKNHPNITIFNSYPKEKVIQFMNEWAEEKRKKDVSDETRMFFEEELKESIQNLDYLDLVDAKSIYVEEEGNLLGFTIFFPMKDFWVGLIQKSRFSIIGLPQFLYTLIAKEIGPRAVLSTGADAKNENLRKYKELLRPIQVNKIYSVFIGDKLS